MPIYILNFRYISLGFLSLILMVSPLAAAQGSDGNLLEGRITDHKLADYDMLDSKRTAAQPMHDMWLRLTIDTELVVRGAEAVMDAGAHAPCELVTPNYDRLVGLKMGPGWNRAVRERLGGVMGCTHLNEMLAQMATTAMQSLFEAMGSVADRPGGGRYLTPVCIIPAMPMP